MSGPGYRTYGIDAGVWGSGSDLGGWDLGLEFGGLGLGVWIFGFGTWGLGFRGTYLFWTRGLDFIWDSGSGFCLGLGIWILFGTWDLVRAWGFGCRGWGPTSPDHLAARLDPENLLSVSVFGFRASRFGFLTSGFGFRF